MGIFDIFKKKTVDRRIGREKSEEEVETIVSKSQFTKEQNRQKKLLYDRMKFLNDQLEIQNLQTQIEDMEADFYGVEESPQDGSINDQLLMNIVSPLLKKMSSPLTESSGQTTLDQGFPPQPDQITLSDDQIRGIIEELPKTAYKAAKKMPDAELLDEMHLRFPNITQDSKIRAVEIIKNGKR